MELPSTVSRRIQKKQRHELPYGAKRVSLFAITINTNHSPVNAEEAADLDRALVRGLHDAVTLAADDPGYMDANLQPHTPAEHLAGLKQIINWLSPNAKKVSENDGTECTFETCRLEEIDVTYRTEIGSKLGRSHMHITVQLVHYALLHMNPHGWREIMLRQLRPFGIENIYVFIKAMKPSKKLMELYLEKPAEPLRKRK